MPLNFAAKSNPKNFKAALNKLGSDQTFRGKVLKNPETLTTDFHLSVQELHGLRQAAVLSGVDMTAAVVAFVSFLAGTVLGGRLARHLDGQVRLWLTVALGVEVVVLLTLSILAGVGVLNYHDNGKLILIAGLAVTFGCQNATARQFGIQELSTTVLTQTIVGLGFDSRLAGGTGKREKLRYSVVLTMCAGAVLGATMTKYAVAPVIALAAVLVAIGAAVFWFGPAEPKA